ncbi:hypothetical protein ACFV2U_13920 [Streptomyces sp. NPDC059697]|uniref:hypothetical protein n=1 Tax=Streptomyces sp. NPDC059697 TaxID=3346912 RepID=UPI00369E7495
MPLVTAHWGTNLTLRRLAPLIMPQTRGLARTVTAPSGSVQIGRRRRPVVDVDPAALDPGW